jgi:hypothetical protein
MASLLLGASAFCISRVRQPPEAETRSPRAPNMRIPHAFQQRENEFDPFTQGLPAGRAND